MTMLRGIFLVIFAKQILLLYDLAEENQQRKLGFEQYKSTQSENITSK
jgi:hypothetical protein